MGCLCMGDFLLYGISLYKGFPCVCIYMYIYIYKDSYLYLYIIYTYIYVVRQGGCDYLFVYTYVLLLSRAWDHVGSQDKIRKRAEGLKLKSKFYFIWARIPQQHASNLRNLQGLNREVLESYNGNCPYSKSEMVKLAVLTHFWMRRHYVRLRVCIKVYQHDMEISSCIHTRVYPKEHDIRITQRLGVYT